jgi:hypothetical protein
MSCSVFTASILCFATPLIELYMFTSQQTKMSNRNRRGQFNDDALLSQSC